MSNENSQNRANGSSVEDAFVLPTSFAQQRLWFLDQLEPGSSVYNVPFAVRIGASLDLAALERSLQEIVQRHEVLRTTFSSGDGQPMQVIWPNPAFGLLVIDLSGLDRAYREAETRRLATEQARTPFDLGRLPLFRASLLRLLPEEHLLLVTMHHIVSDGWSLAVFRRELAALYEAFSQGRQSPLMPLPIQYADYAVWQRETMRGEKLESQLSYWRTRLSGAPTLLELPSDRPRASIQSLRGSRLFVDLPRDLTAALDRLSRSEGVSLFMTLLAGFQVLLSRYTGQEDVVVGSPVAGRNRTETEGLIGLFVNTLVLRTDLSGDPPFRELLRRVSEATLGAYARQDLPFEKLVEELQPTRSLSHPPFFQVLFALENTPRSESTRFTPTQLDVDPGVARSDLSLFLRQGAGGLSYILEYSTDLFDADTMTRLTAHLRTLFEGIASDPDRRISELPLLSAAERHRVLVSWNDTRTQNCGDPLPRLFESRAEQSPDRVAVEFQGGSLTYRELDQRANALAWRLHELGVGPGVFVGICVERSAEMLIALLGVLKAGGAYVPLDPSHPQQRLAYMLEDSGAAVLITEKRLSGALPAVRTERIFLEEASDRAPRPPTTPISSDDVAYVIYTSGSTGRPKGVLVTHGSLTNLLLSMSARPGMESDDVLLAVTTLSFDIAGLELYLPLVVGGRSVVASRETASDGASLGAELERCGATLMQATPATWQMLLDSGWRGKAGLKILCGGEALSPQLARGLLEVSGSVWNLYGPTETTIWSSCDRVEDPTDGVISIGRPIANTKMYVLDGKMEPVPPGVAGELYIGGAGVARGYRNLPELTGQRFLADPFADGGRLYRTGDSARYLSDGRLEFLGRRDDQVKIRGYRVEPGEVQATLAEHPAIREAAVLALPDARGETRLVAYFVARTKPSATPGMLRAFLAARLPSYMLPHAFVALEAIPRTRNGKIDRPALAAPDASCPIVEAGFDEPRSPIDEILAGLWAEVLDLERVGIRDDFFELGGHSLKATQLISRIRATFGRDVPLRVLFEGPTVAELSDRIASLETGRGSPLPAIQRVPREGPLPVSFGQQRLWFLSQLEPGSSAYNIRRVWRLSGRLDREALSAGLSEVVRRHESLRTVFSERDGEAVQLVTPPREVDIPMRDLSDLPGDRAEGRAGEIVAEESERPFDLARGPLFRAILVRLSPNDHVFAVTLHHIVSDGWSLGLFFQELGELYSGMTAGSPARLPELPIQYADYAVWQRNSLRGEALERQLRYWKERLAGAPPVLEVSARPRPPVATGRGAYFQRTLDEELTRELRRLSRRHGATLFMTLVAAFDALVACQTGREDVVVGTDIANRSRVETEALIGFFVNLLVLRTDCSGDPTFEDLLDRVKEVALQAYANSDVPFEKLVEELAPERSLSRNPLVQVLVVMQNEPARPFSLEGIVAQPLSLGEETSRFDLVLFLAEREGLLRMSWLYNRDALEESEVSRLAAGLEAILRSVVRDPQVRIGVLDLSTEEEKGRQEMERQERQRSAVARLRNVRRRGVDLSQAGEVETSFLPGLSMPLVLRPRAAEIDLAEWGRGNRDFLESTLRKHGAILFRDFGVQSPAEFERFASGLCPELFGEYGDLPREELGGRVYGSTPYPADQAILFHNESSHMHQWPMKIWFFCVQAAREGGETPIVDCRTVYGRLDSRLKERFLRKRLLYVRNYTDGLDVSWASFFGTDDRGMVESYCRKNGIEFEWKGENGLQTRQICRAIVRHPQTGEMSFFNQLQLHHVSCLEPAVKDSLLSMMREEDLPRNVYYGDGSRIEDAAMEEMRSIYRETAVQFSWQAGDVLMLNNMLVAHARNPFVGSRKIVVAMGEMVHQTEISD